jgi:fructose-specific phosphotransferase system IIC component
MDTAHVILVFLGSLFTGNFIEKWVQQKRSLTSGEVSFLLFAPVVVAALCMSLLETSGFTAWYQAGEVHSARDLGGSFGSIAAGSAAMWLTWGLYRVLRRKPKANASQPG